jgi:ribonuclease Z
LPFSETFLKAIPSLKPMKLTVLGTSSMVPTKDRNVTGIYFEHKGEGMLLDCGEGTQRQMSIAGINRIKVKKVLITHWHGDHVSGLVGLIQTIGHGAEEPELTIYGPKGSKEVMYHLLRSCIFYNKVKINIEEIDTKTVKTVFENNDYQIQAINVQHSVPCVAYNFIIKDQYNINVAKAEKHGIKPGPKMGELQRKGKTTINGKTIKVEDVATLKKGKKVAFIFDTRICKPCFDIAEDADLLISESSFEQQHAERAAKVKHLSTKDAADIATQANVKQLLITHFSQRYKDTQTLKKEITDLFPNSLVAFDLMNVKL